MAVARSRQTARAGANLWILAPGAALPTPRHIKDARLPPSTPTSRAIPWCWDSGRAQGDCGAACNRFRLRLRLDEAIFTTGGKLALFNTIQFLWTTR